MIALWLAAVRWTSSAVTALFDYLSGERLRDLGRLEQAARQQEAADEAQRKAADIDARPDITDRVDLLARLRRPENNG